MEQTREFSGSASALSPQRDAARTKIHSRTRDHSGSGIIREAAEGLKTWVHLVARVIVRPGGQLPTAGHAQPGAILRGQGRDRLSEQDGVAGPRARGPARDDRSAAGHRARRLCPAEGPFSRSRSAEPPRPGRALPATRSRAGSGCTSARWPFGADHAGAGPCSCGSDANSPRLRRSARHRVQGSRAAQRRRAAGPTQPALPGAGYVESEGLSRGPVALHPIRRTRRRLP